jgi:hypothetical protein
VISTSYAEYRIRYFGEVIEITQSRVLIGVAATCVYYIIDTNVYNDRAWAPTRHHATFTTNHWTVTFPGPKWGEVLDGSPPGPLQQSPRP